MRKLSTVIAIVVAMFMVLGQRAAAQAQGRDPVGGAGSSESRRSGLMTSGTTPAKTPAERRIPFKQMQEDFEQLQLLNNRLSLTVNSGPTIDYTQIGKDSAEIKKRAARLKKNLLLPEPVADQKLKPAEEELAAKDLKIMVNDLDVLVKSFVQNPVFQQPDIVDVEGWGRARMDLEGIIKLSAHIQKNAENGSKASGKKL